MLAEEEWLFDDPDSDLVNEEKASLSGLFGLNDRTDDVTLTDRDLRSLLEDT